MNRVKFLEPRKFPLNKKKQIMALHCPVCGRTPYAHRKGGVCGVLKDD